MEKVAASIILTVTILAGCSAEKHRTEDQLKGILETLSPQIINVQSLTIRYSPMKQASGTSLPPGSVQATCKVVAKLNQDLYVKSDGLGLQMPEPKVITDLMRRAHLAGVQGFELSNLMP